MTTDESTVDFEVTFSDGSSERVTAREIPHAGMPLWEVGRWAGGSPERAATTWAWETCRVRCARSLGIDAIRRVSPPSAPPPSDAALFFVREFASDADLLRAIESADRVDEMRRATADVRRKVADAAREVLNGVPVRTVKVGAASDGVWSIEDAENAIYAATWGRPVTGYVVGLGREMVVVLKQVPRCP